MRSRGRKRALGDGLVEQRGERCKVRDHARHAAGLVRLHGRAGPRASLQRRPRARRRAQTTREPYTRSR